MAVSAHIHSDIWTDTEVQIKDTQINEINLSAPAKFVSTFSSHRFYLLFIHEIHVFTYPKETLQQDGNMLNK